MSDLISRDDRKKSRRTKPLSGAAKMRAAGRRGVLLSVTQTQHELLGRAAFVEMRPVSQYVVFHALDAARETLVKAGVECPS
jgi:uncharacterized protein (DUF1778 family)